MMLRPIWKRTGREQLLCAGFHLVSEDVPPDEGEQVSCHELIDRMVVGDAEGDLGDDPENEALVPLDHDEVRGTCRDLLGIRVPVEIWPREDAVPGSNEKDVEARLTLSLVTCAHEQLATEVEKDPGPELGIRG